MNKKSEILLVNGPIGVGKSKMAEKALEAGYVVHPELNPDDNPAFGNFYKSLKAGERPNPHVLASQLNFLRASYQQALEIIRQIQIGIPQILWDMPITAHYTYADMQQQQTFPGQQPIMSAEHFKEYKAEFRQLVQIMSEINSMATVTVVMLYVTHVGTLMRRIEERGRPEEKGIDQDYVGELHFQWASRQLTNRLLPHSAEYEMSLDTRNFYTFWVNVNAEQYNWTNPAGFAATLEYIFSSRAAVSQTTS